MRSLLELQREFGAALSGGAASAGAARGMSVYFGNTRGNRAKALAAAYPVVQKIVGGEFFEGMAQAYTREFPSSSGDLNEFGAQLAGFVAHWPHTQDLPYLQDVARMEWLAHRAYFAADPPAPDLGRIAAMPEDQLAALPLARAPGSAMLVSEWPLARLWAVHQDDFAGEFEVDLRRSFERILVHRPGWRVEVRAIAPGDYRFLAEAGRGATLGSALQAAAEVAADFDPGSALARWVSLGAITL